MTAQIISLSDENTITTSTAGLQLGPIPNTLFGGIFLDIQPKLENVKYSDHYREAQDYLSLGLVRYPDGELPDGFAVKDKNGNWSFMHNKLNNGDRVVTDPNSGQVISSETPITQSFLDSLTPAMSLKFPDLINPNLLFDEGTGSETGRLGFSGALDLAVKSGSTFSLVLPEFQYLRPAVTRQTLSDGTKQQFVADEHVKLEELINDTTNFLNDLFLLHKHNNGVLPSDIIIELGNESYFGWNSHYFQKDSKHDFDSYSGFVFGSLTAIDRFRVEHPDIEFKVSIQSLGRNFAEEIGRNLDDMQSLHLFSDVDVIDTPHIGLDSTIDKINQIENDWSITSGITAMLDLIESAGGERSGIQVYNSAWSAKSSDAFGFGDVSYGLPSAGAALSLFSGFAELGVDYSANWGIGSWDGFGTNSTKIDHGISTYSPYAEVHRLMAESLVGTYQFRTSTMDNIRSDDSATYAFADDSKVVVFLAANDFVGTKTIAISDFGDIGYSWAERVGVKGSQDGGFETVISREQVAVVDNSIDIQIHNPFEVVRVIVSLAQPGHGYLHLWGGDGPDNLKGGSGSDLLEGNAGNDYISAGMGDDQVFGGPGDDTVYGNQGDDTVFGGAGNDKLVGGQGIDTLSYKDLHAGVTVWIDEGVAEKGFGEDEFKMFERFVGSSEADSFRVWHTDSVEISAGGGNDSIIVGFSTNVLAELGSGDDMIISYGQATEIHGGSGDDTIEIVGPFGDGHVVNGGKGEDRISVVGENTFDLYYDSGDGNDTISGFKLGTDRLFIDQELAGLIDAGLFETSESAAGAQIVFSDGDSLLFHGLDALKLAEVIQDAFIL